ncbi:MAG: peptide chain release factor N(5)-glutamine methyltransferase [Burkholderiaceae bacterium]
MIVGEAIDVRAIPRHEVFLLLAFASACTREQLIARSTEPLAASIEQAFVALVQRRIEGEPIAYLLGRREFYGRDFAVDSRVLIPRPETELLVDLALEWLAQRTTTASGRPLQVLDLGTGSGAIGITLALERPSIAVTATDVSQAALDIAAHNARGLAATVRLVETNWLTAFDSIEGRPEHFDLIVSNPPYIAADDPHLFEGDLRREPRSALTDGADGLQAIRHIVAESTRHLRVNSCLMLEHGYDQAAQVRELLSASGFTEITSSRDIAGIERVTKGTNSSAQSDFESDMQSGVLIKGSKG